MTKKLLFLSTFICLAQLVEAQKLQPLSQTLEALQPVNVFPVHYQDGYAFIDKNKDTKPSVFTVVASSNNSPLITAEVAVGSSNHFGVQSSWRSVGPIKKGDVLLARANIHSVYARQESGDAVVNFFVQQANAPFERNILLELNVGPEWKTIDIPFVALNDMFAGEASIGFTYGALVQKVEITDLQLLNFGQKAALAQMPATKLTYAGRQEGAAWRKEALARIEKIRTAPLIIQVTDTKGKPVKGAAVNARLTDPAFLFASAVSANLLVSNDSTSVTYRRNVVELFNAVTLDNNLKWEPWRDPQRREVTKKAVQWILDNHLRLRGHNLVWPGRKFTPAAFNKKPDFGPGFSDTINEHIRDIVTYARGKVYGWDVINEMVHEKDYFEFMPRSQAAEWFKLARKYDPKATLFINEYSMLNNVASPQNIQTYLDLIKELQSYGAPIDAIGVQGHVGRQPRSPAQVLTDLDMFTSTGLPVQITEFDINTPDEELQADYTRDFLIAVYSHPVVTGFTMWGFWEPAHWKPDAAMYKKDWSPKPNAAAYKDLVLNKWRTKISAMSDSNGKVDARGHLGKYEITVTRGGITKTTNYTLTKESGPLLIKL